MNKLLKDHNPKKHAKSFQYAFEGILHALMNEANFRIHIFATAVVISLGFYFKIAPLEWTAVILVTALVLISEMVNTVIEILMDHMFTKYHSVAKITKDLGAGFVLVSATAGIAIFLIIFGPRLKALFHVSNNINVQVGTEFVGEADQVIENTKSESPNNQEDVYSEDNFYGTSLIDSCTEDSDCVVSGCNAEICGTEELSSICVVPDEPTPKDLDLTCSCVSNVCKWN